MDNNEKINGKSMESLDDAAAEKVAGGAHLDKIICCTCGGEITLKGPMMGNYYNNNVCPICKGRLKTW